MSIIVNREDWVGSPANIKGTNKDTKIYVEKSTTVHNLLFSPHTQCMSYVTNTFLWLVPQFGANNYCVLCRVKAKNRSSEKRTVFRERSSRKNCELRGTDNVQGQISEHIFAPNGDYCLYYPSNLFRNARSFENWGIFSDIPQFHLGNIRPRDAFRPIARKQKDLMDYKLSYLI